MYGIQSKTLPTASILILLLIAPLAMPAIFASPIAVTTDKSNYAAGDNLSVSGTTTAIALISIQVFDPSNVRKAVSQAVSDADGIYSASNIYKFSSKDTGGTWKVSVYDASSAETAEATFTVAITTDLTAPTLTLSIAPDKTLYGKETVTITVTADEALASTSISVTQAGAARTATQHDGR